MSIFRAWIAGAIVLGVPTLALAAQGDFNGDGFSDLAIAAHRETLEGPGIAEAGQVTILYGSGSGLQATSPPRQNWTRNSAGVNGNAGVQEQFGYELCPGDFNGDLYWDLAVSSFDTAGGHTDAGAVNVLYGSASGLQTTSPADQLWNEDLLGAASAIDEGFGYAMTRGDFDGDGFDDLAVSSIYEDFPPARVGVVFILYGSVLGLQSASPVADIWYESLGLGDGVDEFDGFGVALAAGDFNDDTLDDLAIGAPYETIGSSGEGGAVDVLYGTSSGLQLTNTQSWNEDSPGVLGAVSAGNRFGYTLSAGDYDGDGFADLAITDNGLVIGTASYAGGVHVLYGDASGLVATGNQMWTQDSFGVNEVAENIDQFGFSLDSGDFNDDGFGDLAIGVPFESVGTLASAGGVNVLYGSGSGLQTSAPLDQFWSQNKPGVNGAANAGDLFGFSLRVGDFNGDARSDLAIGVPQEVTTKCTVGRCGAVNVLYGTIDGGLQATLPADQLWAQGKPEVSDNFGWAL